MSLNTPARLINGSSSTAVRALRGMKRAWLARAQKAGAGEKGKGVRSARKELMDLLQRAVEEALPQAKEGEIRVEWADPQFGDYQANVAMALYGKVCKPMGKDSPYNNAGHLAEAIVGRIPQEDPIREVHVAGPGFINFTLSEAWLACRAREAWESGLEGAPRGWWRPQEPRGAHRAVVDYSSPNVAKRMHVGHLRSTIIGDCLANAMEEAGLEVKRLNHIGDWGTQFGMLIAHIEDQGVETHSLASGDLDALYQAANSRFESEEGFRERAHQAVLRLQRNESNASQIWRSICDASRREFSQVYDRLGVSGLEERGESFYANRVNATLADLREAGVAEEDSGALMVFPDEGNALVAQKSDGAVGYAGTDLAAVRHRVHEELADWVVYVTDSGQGGHFDGVFWAAERAGWVREGRPKLEHAGFGVVLGKDGKRLKSREGGAAYLTDLLEDACERARAELKQRGTDREMDEAEAEQLAERLGIAAVKYADLRNNRRTDYRFDADSMLDLRGDTAVYSLYALTRITSLLSRAGDRVPTDRGFDVDIFLDEPQERALALQVVRLPEAVEDCLEELQPNRLTAYCHGLATAFSDFYERCPVLGSEHERSRLILASAAGAALRRALRILGIPLVTRL